MRRSVILIPAYNPNQKLLKLVKDLERDFAKIIIVNDGSKEGLEVFCDLKKNNNCVVLEYKDNHGKGYALKYGIDYYLKHLIMDYIGIITVDADYQHLPLDIIKIAKEMEVDDSQIILGVRNFYEKKIPILNKIGNRFTSFIFRILYGKKIQDTQTGLRGIPNKYVDDCLEIDGDRFEYEIEKLIYFVNNKIPIKEVMITTIYYTKGESKFNKLIDSLKIYKVLLKESFRFLVTSLVSSFLDIILFTISLSVLTSMGDLKIIFSTFIARIIADFLNFNLTKYFVFNTKEEFKKILVKYYILSIVKMALSAILVLLLSKLISINETFIKVCVDIFIYFLSYRIQKKYIFKT